MQLGMHKAKAQAENQSLTLLENHKKERGKNRPRVLGKWHLFWYFAKAFDQKELNLVVDS